MNDDRRSILQMLAEGKITADEAERLIAALEKAPPAPDAGGVTLRPRPKFLRVQVEADQGSGRPAKVNVRVPMQLLRAGVRLSGLVPPEAREKVNAAMREKGMSFDINQLKPENLDELVEQLNDLTVDVDDDHARVRIFCE
ncbi:MAG: hypothetical protein ACHP9T_05410 [Caulobacterales bacterium]|jgi:hypothetical protein